ncbi:hypothetical protein EW146_g8242 [Bondarzewia mesenterica]|uniref:Uncharacterized protein n=1 Tax=Bondarzewia mesenterica TaxID=1095465 RepID=A0A4S4LG47_9AGAM|nr:hypothetical protein EW146_g8242 [Bondarzewia mesenterica]
MAPLSTPAVLSSTRSSSTLSYIGLAFTVLVLSSSILSVGLFLCRRRRRGFGMRNDVQVFSEPKCVSRASSRASSSTDSVVSDPQSLLPAHASPSEKPGRGHHSNSTHPRSSYPRPPHPHIRPRLAQGRLPAHRSNTPAPLIVGRPASIQARIASVTSTDQFAPRDDPAALPIIALTLPSPSYDPARRVPRRSVKFTFEGGYLSPPLS